MNKLLIAAPLCAALALAVEAGTLERVHACSGDASFDRIATSDVIVEGRFLRYEVLHDGYLQDPYTPIRVDMSVSRVFKGDIAEGPFSIVDPTSYALEFDLGHQWAGSGGACGAFDEDPTGKFAILGLMRQEDGTYRPNRLLYFFYGNEPTGDGYQRAVSALSSLPNAGFGVAFGDQLIVPAFLLGGVGAALFTSGVFLRKRRAA